MFLVHFSNVIRSASSQTVKDERDLNNHLEHFPHLQKKEGPEKENEFPAESHKHLVSEPRLEPRVADP